MTATVATPICCPRCGRHVTAAVEITGQRLKCKSCKAQLDIDLKAGVLTVVAIRRFEA